MFKGRVASRDGTHTRDCATRTRDNAVRHVVARFPSKSFHAERDGEDLVIYQTTGDDRVIGAVQIGGTNDHGPLSAPERLRALNRAHAEYWRGRVFAGPQR
jgi:hypothetical protein